MANFCTEHGCALENGVCPQCACNASNYPRIGIPYTHVLQRSNNFLISILKRMGIYEPDVNEASAADLYERNRKIVPDCVVISENEQPVRQYDVALLRSRMKLMRAEGRMQITNKRLLFRAKGRSLMGRTTLQYEFALNDIAGVDVRKDYRFGVLDIIFGIIIAYLISTVFSGFSNNIFMNDNTSGVIFALFIGVAGIVPFFAISKRFFLKLLCCSISTGSIMGVAAPSLFTSAIKSALGDILGNYVVHTSNNKIMIFIFSVSVIIELAALLLFAFKPNLVIIIKTKYATDAMEIKRKTNRNECTGFHDIIAVPDTDKAIREIGTIISDFNTNGDQALEKWIITDQV